MVSWVLAVPLMAPAGLPGGAGDRVGGCELHRDEVKAMNSDDGVVDLVWKLRELAREAYKTGGAKPFDVAQKLKAIDELATAWLKPDDHSTE